MKNENDENKESSIINFIHFQYRCWSKFLMLKMTLWKVKTSWYVRVWKFNSSINFTINCRFDTCINIMYVNQMQTISHYCVQITFINICDVKISIVLYHNSTKQKYIIQTCLVVVDDFDKNFSTSYVDNYSKRKLFFRFRFVARVIFDFNIEKKKTCACNCRSLHWEFCIAIQSWCDRSIFWASTLTRKTQKHNSSFFETQYMSLWLEKENWKIMFEFCYSSKVRQQCRRK